MDELAAALLWLGVEDATGLWDARAEVLARAPGTGPDVAARTAGDVLRELADRRLVQILVGGDALDDGGLGPVYGDRTGAVLGDPESYEPPATRHCRVVKFATTSEGLAAYLASEHGAHARERE